MKRNEIHPTSGYSLAEERANAWTHIVGSILSLVGLVVATVWASQLRDPFLIVACAIYGMTLFGLHLSSSLYHSSRNLIWKRRFLVADHSFIYLLIAGTYTPFALGPLRGPLGWSMLGTIWGLAIVGIMREFNRPERGTWLSTGVYLIMGWLVVLLLIPLANALTTSGLVLLILGGVIYSLGTIFYKWHSLKYHHAIWHVMVMAAAATQFFSVLTILAAE